MKKLLLSSIILMAINLQGQYLNPLKADNQLHFAAGMSVGTGAILFNEKVLDESLPNGFVAIGSAFAVGFFKEVIDMNQPHNRFDWAELVWTTAGGVVSYALHKLGVPKQYTFGVGVGFIGVRMTLIK